MVYLSNVADPPTSPPEPYTLVLASQSPRRREILATAGIRFTVRVSPVEEVRGHDEDPDVYVRRLAREKAEASAKLSEVPGREIVLAADTTVVLGRQVLEKPHDVRDAESMLARLAGREHRVITGFAIHHPGGEIVDSVSTLVRFSPMSREEIAAYVASGEPMDKAGAYAIQGLASKFIASIDGCFFNVVGLPISHVYRYLQKLNHSVA